MEKRKKRVVDLMVCGLFTELHVFPMFVKPTYKHLYKRKDIIQFEKGQTVIASENMPQK